MFAGFVGVAEVLHAFVAPIQWLNRGCHGVMAQIISVFVIVKMFVESSES